MGLSSEELWKLSVVMSREYHVNIRLTSLHLFTDVNFILIALVALFLRFLVLQFLVLLNLVVNKIQIRL